MNTYNGHGSVELENDDRFRGNVDECRQECESLENCEAFVYRINRNQCHFRGEIDKSGFMMNQDWHIYYQSAGKIAHNSHTNSI